MSVDFDFYLAVRTALEFDATKHPSWVKAWFVPRRVADLKEHTKSERMIGDKQKTVGSRLEPNEDQQ